MDKKIIKNLLEIKKNLIKEPAIIFEVGCAEGTDTLEFIDSISNLQIHCFEPEAKNIEKIKNKINFKNFYLFEGAVSDSAGEVDFYRSSISPTIEWLYSGSIKKPKNHLNHWRHIKFDESYKVKTITLDIYSKEKNINFVDFIWADVQGAEENMILGAAEILKNTCFLYTEYSYDQTYESQIDLNTIKEKLGNNWIVLKDWNKNRPGGGDVLLYNKNLYDEKERQKILEICKSLN